MYATVQEVNRPGAADGVPTWIGYVWLAAAEPVAVAYESGGG